MNGKTLLLICTAGITTGLLVRSIEIEINKRNLDLHVYSAPAIIAEQIIDKQKIDGILIGPQAKYEIERLKTLLNYKNIPYRLINGENYSLLNGQGVLEEGINLLH